MAGLVPAIHVLLRASAQDVDARDERGHDDSNNFYDFVFGRWSVSSVPSLNGWNVGL
jgi:hypothetical protein